MNRIAAVLNSLVKRHFAALLTCLLFMAAGMAGEHLSPMAGDYSVLVFWSALCVVGIGVYALLLGIVQSIDDVREGPASPSMLAATSVGSGIYRGPAAGASIKWQDHAAASKALRHGHAVVCSPTSPGAEDGNSFGTSMAVGIASDSAFLGAAIGGSLAGGLVGEALADSVKVDVPTLGTSCSIDTSINTDF